MPDALGAPIDDEPVAIEGRVIHRLVRTRERDPKLRERKINQALTHRGHLACEVRSFDFERTYGVLGAGSTPTSIKSCPCTPPA